MDATDLVESNASFFRTGRSLPALQILRQHVSVAELNQLVDAIGHHQVPISTRCTTDVPMRMVRPIFRMPMPSDRSLRMRASIAGLTADAARASCPPSWPAQGQR